MTREVKDRFWSFVMFLVIVCAMLTPMIYLLIKQRNQCSDKGGLWVGGHCVKKEMVITS